MSDLYYDVVRAVGSGIFWMTSRPRVLHRDRTDRPGAFIVASSHHSPYDVPLLIRHSVRHLDFVSTTKVFSSRFVAWFYGSMNAFPIDKSRPDSAGVRTILARLSRGRAVALFPEGAIRRPPNSITHGGSFHDGVLRLTQMAQVPVMPCVVIRSEAYGKIRAWLPLKKIRYGVIFGQPLSLRADLDPADAAEALKAELREAFVHLYQELNATLTPPATGD